MITSKKGQIKTLEAFLGVIIIFSALTLSVMLSPQPNKNNGRSLDQVGMQTLIELDINGTLGKLIDEANSASLSESLNVLLPLGVSYNLTVYDAQGNPLNNLTATNGNLAGHTIESVHYLCASQSLKPKCYLLQLQLALAG
ncbi:MAG: hypothetical protein JSV58_02495 [Candidatus Bathyarchaeota archaeon]|nr:MAG: hypothetical protein JSV58_02495 [Candidatus Bathyarchaeota archaeon]